MSAVLKVHRVVIDSYPTPDGKPFDQQHINDYETAVQLHYNPGAPFDMPKWLEGIDLSERLYTGSDDWTEGPIMGATIIGYDHEPLLTVPVLRRVNFFSRTAASGRLAQLTAWGAVGRVESSAPIEWPTA
jgi:hypothetical protein